MAIKAARAPLPDRANELSRIIIDCAITVHRKLGAGLLESTYRICLVHELRKRGLTVAEEVHLPVEYDGLRLESGPDRFDR